MDGVFYEEPVNALIGWKNAAWIGLVAKVVICEEPEYNSGQRVDAILAVGGDGDGRQRMLQNVRNMDGYCSVELIPFFQDHQ